MRSWTVLMRLEGPLQAWGTGSRFGDRGTETEPSKSGVIGLLCAALGVAREDGATLAQLAGLEMAVRVDRPGVVLEDFATIGGGLRHGHAYGAARANGGKPQTATARRVLLVDASFLVGLGGLDRALIVRAAEALSRPRWSLSLGPKACVPTRPILEPPGVLPGRPAHVLMDAAWDASSGSSERRRLVVEAVGPHGARRDDVPLSFAPGARRFGRRWVHELLIAPPGPGDDGPSDRAVQVGEAAARPLWTSPPHHDQES